MNKTKNQQVTEAWSGYLNGEANSKDERLLQEILAADESSALELLEDRQMDSLLAAMNRIDHQRDGFTKRVMEACASNDSPLATATSTSADVEQNQRTQVQMVAPPPVQSSSAARPQPPTNSAAALDNASTSPTSDALVQRSKPDANPASRRSTKNRMPFVLATIFASTSAVLLCVVVMLATSLNQQRQRTDQVLVHLDDLNSQIDELKQRTNRGPEVVARAEERPVAPWNEDPVQIPLEGNFEPNPAADIAQRMPEPIRQVNPPLKQVAENDALPVDALSDAELHSQELDELWQMVHERKQETQVANQKSDDWNAKLVSLDNAKWRTPPAGDLLTQGEHELVTGQATLEMPTGTKVRLEAPARFEVLNAGELRLDEGTLALLTPELARNFEVRTPSAEILDLGGGFKVVALDDGSTDVIANDGNVLVNQWPGAQDRKVELTAQDFDKLHVSPMDGQDKAHWSELAGQRGFLGQLGVGNRFIDLNSKPHFEGLRDSLVQSVADMPEAVEAEWNSLVSAFDPATGQVTINGVSKAIEDIKTFSDIVEFNWPDSPKPERRGNRQFMGRIMINGELKEFDSIEEYREAMREQFQQRMQLLREGQGFQQFGPQAGGQNGLPFNNNQRQRDLNNNPFQPK